MGAAGSVAFVEIMPSFARHLAGTNNNRTPDHARLAGMPQPLREATAESLLAMRGSSFFSDRLKQPRYKVLQITAPRLPFVICAGRLIKNMLDLALV